MSATKEGKSYMSHNVDAIYQNVGEIQAERNHQCKSNKKTDKQANIADGICQNSHGGKIERNHQQKQENGYFQHSNIETVCQNIDEIDVEKEQPHENGSDRGTCSYLQGKRFIETISRSLYKKDGIVHIKTEEASFEKSYRRRGSTLETLWTKEKKFLLISLSISSGIGCLWRFPSIAYDTGGSFLICYIIMLIVIGMPLYYMESSFSQFSSSGPLKIWRSLPALKGIAFSQMVATIYLAIYVGYIMSLSLFYILSSMQQYLPWKNITNVKCNTDFEKSCDPNIPDCENKQNYSDANQISAQAYWRLHLLQSDAKTFMHFNWKLGFFLLLTWITIFICFFKRSKLRGKFLFVTSTYPCIGLLLCFTTILLKDGIKEGLIYAMKPKIKDLCDIKIWYEACVQCFISLGVGFGHILVYSRHNGFRENIPKNCALTGVYHICVTILSSMLFFSILGIIAKSKGSEDIRSLCYNGGNRDIISPVFIVYSEGFELIPQFWTILFFLILFTSALSNMMIYIESISGTLSLKSKVLQNIELTAFYVCALCCICGLFLITNIGPVIVNSMDKYGVSITVFICSIMEVIGIFWMYGYKCFFRDINFMSRSETNILVKIFYSIVLPIALMIIGIYGIDHFVHNHHYHVWISVLGWILIGIALIQLPIWLAESYVRAPEWGFKNKVKFIFKPKQNWGPGDPLHYKDWLQEKVRIKSSFYEGKVDFDNPVFHIEYK